MFLFLKELVAYPVSPVAGGCLLALLVYIIYQRFLHPLAKYPGPFLASLTDLWQVHQFMTLKQPYHLTELHEKYGPIVRYGPDKLSITDESSIPLIYQKGSRMMPKTEFYDAYGAAHPNVFGMRDEDLHSIRRRHMSHSFSISYVKEMEQYLDLNIKILKDKLRAYAAKHEVFDLKKALHYYVIDTLGELAFSQSFGVQLADDESLVPPVIEHSLLAAVTGSWPLMTERLKRWLPLVPHQGLQKLFKGRQACADLASRCVQRRLEIMQNAEKDGIAATERKDILTNLILAKHPDTGERLTKTDLETEAFGFIIAGTHTTGATAALLFYHLLHAPEIMAKCVAEIDANLPPLEPDQPAYPVSLVEASLPYLRDCIRENFRITPVFTMPLARRVLAPEGITVAGNHIPQGTSVAVCNHAFHHNPDVWGPDHNVFNPSRWKDPKIAEKSKLLMHFGLGGRQCIGKNVATTNIYKLMSTLLREFEFELADEKVRLDVKKGLYRGKVPALMSVGISDLEGPLLVRVRERSKAS
ncbi:Benzoate 4-monooxygenase [Rasamsonia emersonii CBS 393.64]|uniref:Benzoate 4-monooxygenase n=1 Tax=Rasamsonia emersonii (strain ATCC 16479 / CBS 393.64 / IMI 116815) TaxID=1408163 RepID=A0A0F4Z427_RASE3|nr:Benzoate 4-monooxygenase [Rasamsonia emersonii CBS 393.64]KKA24841.1 Benzoate 4-monooxygenase [Rasamsonia emersonii CBS 393.64]